MEHFNTAVDLCRLVDHKSTIKILCDPPDSSAGLPKWIHIVVNYGFAANWIIPSWVVRFALQRERERRINCTILLLYISTRSCLIRRNIEPPEGVARS